MYYYTETLLKTEPRFIGGLPTCLWVLPDYGSGYALGMPWVWRISLFGSRTHPGIEVVDGASPVPTGPGLGIEVNEAEIRRMSAQVLESSRQAGCGLPGVSVLFH